MKVKKEFFNWGVQSPPLNTWVWSSNNPQKNDWQLVKTCKHGCCVHTLFGSLMLPNFWYLATKEEGIKEQESWSKIPQINLNDLYERN